MKKFVKRVLSIVLAAAVLATSVTLPQTAQDVQAASSKAWKKSGGKCYNGKGQVIPGAKTRGIDVSEWQGNIDWDKVANRTVYIGPDAYSLYSTSFGVLQGMAADGNEAPIRFEIFYNLIK